ncbi:phosphatase PAP2 family protein [Melittangium boletus]|uniref:Phosphatidic acid phosphatase n=1 Tax=Melittangium boletus DSM 14713 TaxID=1294270 RepID=A0A250IHK8_9BACT|nr:phosphatase PAP2 family protein [Melittangium boletus]ATB31304.1 phosphatidic acid phosphatase [Melittangium boletus DSM 14713]
MSRPPLFGLPRREEALLTGAMATGFTLFFLLVYGGASWVTGFYPGGLRVDLPFERHIPFVPAWAAVYVSMDVLLLLSLFILRTWRDMVPFVSALALETVLGAGCFLLLPVEVAWPAREVSGDSAFVFLLADTMNLERNYLPSLHVAFACTAALAYGERGGGLARAGFTLWATAIAASTLLIHEHHVVDVLAGALLAWGTWRAVAPLTRREDMLEALRVEGLCAREMVRFSRRNPRYALPALVLYRYALTDWRTTRVARTGFCFLQLVDDVLDGDRPITEEPLDWVDALLARLERGGETGEDVAATLGRWFLAELRDDGARAEALRLVRTMRRDRERVRERRELDAAALRAHHRETFELSVGLMLHTARAEVRALDSPALLDAFGWCSAMRDLREDLDKGLFNVPAEVALAVRAEGAEPWRYDSLVGSAAGRAWLMAEHHRARSLLDEARGQLSALEGRSGLALLRLFHRSIESFWAKRLPRRMPFLRASGRVTPPWPSGAP